MITLKNLRKNYGSKSVLKDINFTFEKGKIYGIVGQNGAGKTTLYKCIAGLESHEGQITTAYDKLKDHLGYLETTPTIMRLITGWEYLRLLCSARDVSTTDFESQNIFNLPLQDYISHYSTGMQKKLALMAVLLQQNDVLILDEPFNGVDIQSNMIISDIIQTLRKHSKTVLISSHIFSTLRETCDEILLLSGGQFAQHAQPSEFGQLEQLMKKQMITTKGKTIRLS